MKFSKTTKYFTFSLMFLFTTIILTAKQETVMNDTYILPDYPQSQLSTELDKKIVNKLKEYNIVGSQLAVIKDNKLVFSKGYGYSDLSTEKPMTSKTVLRVASISKMVTGVAIMQLYENGKLNLNDDISKYLGYLVENPKYPKTPITIKSLLSHTSSIIDSGSYDKILETNNIDGMKFIKLANVPLKEMLMVNGKYYSEKNFGNYKPGSDFKYSNFGYGILGSIVENVSGERFPEYCVKHIFAPLNMDASFDPGDIKQYKEIGTLYRPVKNTTPSVYKAQQDNYNSKKPSHTKNNQPLGNALPYSPAGSVRTNVDDLTHFISMLMNNGEYNNKEILNPSTVKLMLTSHWTGNAYGGLLKSYGYSIHQTEDLVSGVKFFGHPAEAYGLIGDAYFIPDKKFAIIELFTGGKYGEADPYFSIENKIAQLLFNFFYDPSNSKQM